MPAKREDTTSHQRQRQLRRSRRRRRHRRPRRRLARARARAVGRRARPRRARRAGPRAWPPGCSRRSPRPTPASGALLELGLRSARALAGLRRASWARSAASTSAIGRAARCCSPATATRPRRSSASATLRERFGLRVERAAAQRGAPPRARAGADAARALHLPDDHAVDPRRVCAALARAARARRRRAAPRRRGRRPRRAAAPSRSSSPPGRGRAPSATRRACARSRASRCACATRPGPGLLERVVRCGQPSPATSCRAATGATSLGATIGGARLRHRGHRRRPCTSCCATPPSSCPACSSSRSRRRSPACARARPTTRRSSGARRRPRVVWATGHYRNGILLAPLTADLVAAELAGEAGEHAFGPERFAAGGGA